MASLSPLAATTAAGSTAAAATSRASLASNFETFLGLLTTQLKNQSPLDPLDTNQFTQQLVQFAGVEQQLKTNESLTSLIAAAKGSTAASALGLVGATITADGKTTRLTGGKAEWTLQAPRAVTGAVVTIKDANGAAVYSERRNFAAGAQAYSWSGRTSAGSIAADGEYSVNVTALDPAGQPVSIASEWKGRVDGVDVSGAEALLIMGKITVPLSKVKTIQRS